jgi:hypothetical protein
MASFSLEGTILALLHTRGPGKTICPSDAARAVAGPGDPSGWRPLMEPVREAARRLVNSGQIVVTQHGRPSILPLRKAPSAYDCAETESDSAGDASLPDPFLQICHHIPHCDKEAAS